MFVFTVNFMFHGLFNINIILFLASFSQQVYMMVFHKSLRDRKFPPVCRNLLRIPANFSSGVCYIAMMNEGMKNHRTFFHKKCKTHFFISSRRVGFGWKCERETETKESDIGWRRTAILTIFKAPLNASSASPPGPLLPPALWVTPKAASALTWLPFSLTTGWLRLTVLSVGTCVYIIS